MLWEFLNINVCFSLCHWKGHGQNLFGVNFHFILMTSLRERRCAFDNYLFRASVVYIFELLSWTIHLLHLSVLFLSVAKRASRWGLTWVKAVLHSSSLSKFRSLNAIPFNFNIQQWKVAFKMNKERLIDWT